MKYAVSFFMLFLSIMAQANSFLCVGVRSVALIESKSRDYSISEIDVSKKKYLLTQKDGAYQLKEFGVNNLVTPCQTEFFCTCGYTAWCGQFLRRANGEFTYHLDTSFANDSNGSQVIKGYCEKIPP